MSHRGPGVCLWLAYGAGSLAGGGVRAGDVAGAPSDLDAGAACKSSSAIGRGTKWSVAGEAVLRVRVGGLGRANGWETLGSQTPTKTDNVGGKTASPAWAGTAHPVSDASTFERGTTVLANRY